MLTPARSIFIGALAVILPLFFTGCSEKQTPKPQSNESLPTIEPSISKANPSKSVPQHHVSPLEDAEKAYRKSYDNYVRMLRESGPQTMDTLNALADYQQKYQVYQMLLGDQK